MIFSYVQNPRYRKMQIEFVCGKEKVFSSRKYVVGDYIEDYEDTEVLLGEYKNKHGEWLQYWIAVRKGQIVGVELINEKQNKFDIAVKYGLTLSYKILSDTKKVVKRAKKRLR